MSWKKHNYAFPFHAAMVEIIFGRGFFGHLLKMPPAGLGGGQKQY